MTRTQRQKGGARSQQIQVARDLIQITKGITEERAVEIAREQANLAIQEFTAEANITARERIENFDQKVVHELSERGLLQVFSDPAFQILLRKAQLSAATTSEDADHEVLSKLLAERAERPTKPMHLIVTRSVEVIEYLDQEALIGITLLFLVYGLLPSWPDPKEALAQFERIAADLTYGPLPVGVQWLNRLDLLSCIKYYPGLPHGSWDTILFQARPGYVSEGVLPENVLDIRGRLSAIRPDLISLLVPHPFLPGRSRINTGRSSMLTDLLRQSFRQSEKIKELEEILSDAKVDTSNNDAIANMFKYIESELPHLQAVRAWVNNLDKIIQLTQVGHAVAYSNARRFSRLEGINSLADVISS